MTRTNLNRFIYIKYKINDPIDHKNTCGITSSDRYSTVNAFPYQNVSTSPTFSCKVFRTLEIYYDIVSFLEVVFCF